MKSLTKNVKINVNLSYGVRIMELTSAKAVREIQNRFSFTFKKGLGQNFLTSGDILEKIADAAGNTEGIIEVGPGFGALTQRLSAHAKRVVSIEIDERLIEVLEYTLSDLDNVKIVQGDILKIDLDNLIKTEFEGMEVSLAANLPYYITTPIIARLLEEKLPLKSIVVMVQKEVADRIAAKPATKDYGAISVLCQYFAEPELIAKVPASLFVPPPKVDSAVVRLNMLSEPSVKAANEDMFFKTVRAAFSQRRKTLSNCLCSFFGIPKDELKEIGEAAGIDLSRRGETLSLDEFARLSDEINAHMK